MSDTATPDAPRPGSTASAHGVGSSPNTDDAPTIISIQKPQPRTPAGRLDASLRGRRLGQYELIEAIGSGGMASVLRATDLGLGRIVALKVLTPELALDADHVTRFQSEARAAAKLDHQNVARIYGCGEDQGLYYIAFEFVEGVTLRDVIEKRGALPAAELLPLMVQIADGLAHAAERGVVHRDVKPSNIIVGSDGRAKLVDMGLARHLDGAAGGVTQSGVTLGTFDYISPEQALEPRTADARSDIYSLGCTMYHALTGRPPVPDGTAAKKLQHHQSVPPPDPRTLNPAIPDSVATVLARMMAKDPGERYQQVEQLVDDLRVLSESLKPEKPARSSAEVRLWAHAPRPASSARWPLMIGAGATLGVALLVAIMEMTRPPSGPGFHIGPPPRPIGESVVDQQAGAENRGKPDVESPRAPETVHAVATVAELRELFAAAEPVLRIRLTGWSYDLFSGDGIEPAGLIFRGRRLEMEAEDPSRLVTVHFSPGQDDRAAITIVGGDGERVEALVRGIRFNCEALPGDRPLAAIAGNDVHQLDIERCAFAMPEGAAAARGAAAIALDDRDPRDAPSVRLNECLFFRGAQAIQLTSRGSVSASNCAFGPHHALFHLRGTSADTAVRLEHCSAMLDNTSVVLLDDGASARITAGHCLFSRPESLDQPPGDGILIRQVGGKAGDVSYRSLTGPDRLPLRNAYHDLSAFWSDETTSAPYLAATLEEARGRSTFRDDDALELALSPWLNAQPLARLADDERSAFAIDLKLVRLRLPRTPQAGTLGVQRNVWGPSFVKLDPAGGPNDASAIRSLIVDPSRTESEPLQGIFTNLTQALADSRPVDLILIKKNGVLPMDPTIVARPDANITVKPFTGYRPILSLNAAADSDSTMLRLQEGILRFENLQFAVTGSDGRRGQALVAMAGGGRVEFHDCVVTLDESPESQSAVVTLPEMEPAAPPAERRIPIVRFENCFVRGRGDLLTARGGRRFDLGVDTSLIALDGSLATLGASIKDPVPATTSQIRLRRVTVAIADHLVASRFGRDDAKRVIALPPAVQIACDGCLLAPTAGRALVHVDGAESDEQVRQLIVWSNSANAKPTYYANVGPALLDVQPASVDRMPQPGSLDRERWLSFTHDRTTDPFVRLRFAATQLLHAQPNDFRPSWLGTAPTAADDCGAPLDRLPSAFGSEVAQIDPNPK